MLDLINTINEAEGTPCEKRKKTIESVYKELAKTPIYSDASEEELEAMRENVVVLVDAVRPEWSN